MAHTSEAPAQTRLRDLTRLFLKLGFLGFGGPAAHIALMEDEVVERRGWMRRETFVDLLGLTNLVPGPNSTEMAMHVGRVHAGFMGLVVAGGAFILPAAGLMGVLAWAYVAYGGTPVAVALLDGAKPAVVAVVLLAVWRLGRTAAGSPVRFVTAVAAAGAVAVGLDEIVTILAAGVVWIGVRALRQVAGEVGGLVALPVGSAELGLGPEGWFEPAVSRLTAAASQGVAALAGTVVAASAALATHAPEPTLWRLFLFFLRIGAVLFGSGYVLLAFIEGQLVNQWGWITSQELIDAIALGQLTPGPVLTTATFVGYLVAGGPGAVVATVAIFLPAFIIVAVTAPVLPRLRASPIAAAGLDGVNAAAVGLLGWVLVELARAAVTGPVTAAVLAVSLALLFGRGWSALRIVVLGAAVGLIAGATTLLIRVDTAKSVSNVRNRSLPPESRRIGALNWSASGPTIVNGCSACPAERPQVPSDASQRWPALRLSFHRGAARAAMTNPRLRCGCGSVRAGRQPAYAACLCPRPGGLSLPVSSLACPLGASAPHPATRHNLGREICDQPSRPGSCSASCSACPSPLAPRASPKRPARIPFLPRPTRPCRGRTSPTSIEFS